MTLQNTRIKRLTNSICLRNISWLLIFWFLVLGLWSIKVSYCWWKKSKTTTWYVYNSVKNGMNYRSLNWWVDPGFLPSVSNWMVEPLVNLVESQATTDFGLVSRSGRAAASAIHGNWQPTMLSGVTCRLETIGKRSMLAWGRMGHLTLHTVDGRNTAFTTWGW